MAKEMLWKWKFANGVSLRIVYHGSYNGENPPHIKPYTVQKLSHARYRYLKNFKTFEEALFFANSEEALNG